MAHFVRDLRDGVYVGGHFTVPRNFRELLLIKSNVVICSYGSVRGRALLHLVRADVHRLNESPLKPARRAVGVEPALLRADSGDGTAYRAERPVAGSSRFLVVHAKVRVVRQKIEFVAETVDHGATPIARIWQRVIVERLVEKRKRALLWLERRKVDLGIMDATQRYGFCGNPRYRLFGTRGGSVSGNVDLLGAAKSGRQNTLNGNCVAVRLDRARNAFTECNVSRCGTVGAIPRRKSANRPHRIGMRGRACGLRRVRVKVNAIANPCNAWISRRQHGTCRFERGLQQYPANNRKL